ncbi:MAG: hypothetical protein ACOC8F_06940 [Planctomycetota bacterium]
MNSVAVRFAVAAWACGIGGCGETVLSLGGADEAELSRRLQHGEPGVRARALVRAAGSGRRDVLPYLVDRLTDGQDSVRMYAILALERLTGRTLGYRYYDPPARRQDAVKRWRDWLEDRASGTRQPAGATADKG